MQMQREAKEEARGVECQALMKRQRPGCSPRAFSPTSNQNSDLRALVRCENEAHSLLGSLARKIYKCKHNKLRIGLVTDGFYPKSIK
jgi:hypothetical protein